MAKNKKISDKEFLTILRENAGLFARTAKAIQNQFKINYSRQAVRDRALKFPEELKDIEEENIDLAEEGLTSLIQSENETVKFRAIELFLKCKGKARGYIERTEQVITNNEPDLFIIDGKIIDFPDTEIKK